MSGMTILLFLLVSCCALTLTRGAISTCTTNKDICGCDTDQGSISLSKLTAEPFELKNSQLRSTFYWQPCADITKGTITASAIQEMQIIPVFYYDIGDVSSWSSDVTSDGDAIFKMTGADGGRGSNFICKCSKGQDFEFIRQDPPGTYVFQVTSELCCPTGGGSGGLSGGSILLIIALVVFCVYLAAGVAFQVGYRKAEGVERIPNVALWSALPGLIKDGFKFTFTGGKSSGYGEI